MRHPLVLVTIAVYGLVAALLAGSQLSVGGQRLLLGLLLAAPWALSAVALAARPRIGAWLGAGVAAVSLAAAAWYLGESGVARGKEIALLLFTSREGYWSWAGVGITTMGFALLFAIALVLSAALLARRSSMRGGSRPRASSFQPTRRAGCSLGG